MERGCFYIRFVIIKDNNQIKNQKPNKMKKLFIAAILVAAIGTSAFASDAGKVNFRVKNNFETQFSDATNVQWTLTSNYAKASFELNDETVDAFYSLDGEALGLSRKVD